MAITATNKGGSGYEPVAAGTYAARCIQMIHIGTVEELIQGTLKKLNKVRITWELPTELKVFNEEKGLQPCVISKEFTLSMNEKATLRKFLASWRTVDFTDKEAESFDITALLGKPCMLAVVHKTSKSGNVYAEISSVSALVKGMNMPDQINPSVELSYENWNTTIFDALPDFIKDKMRKSDEYNSMTHPAEAQTATEIEDDLPF